MGVLALQAVGDLVGHGLADQAGAGIDERRHRRRRRRRMAAPPVRAAASGDVPGHVVDVLGRERQPGKRALGGAGDAKSALRRERAQRIIQGHGRVS
jgi:hypothetical protein